jgi:hypothetical protein
MYSAFARLTKSKGSMKSQLQHKGRHDMPHPERLYRPTRE